MTVADHRSVLFPVRTERLWLRAWRCADLEPFAAMNADPEVMRFFPAPLARRDSDALAERCATALDSDGFGRFAVERVDSGEFIGFVGLSPVPGALPIAPGMEIGWRLARSAWGQGLAGEAASRVLAMAFECLEFEEIVSFTALANQPSWRLMVRLGMVGDARHFEHPALPCGHPLRTHCLYRMTRTKWFGECSASGTVDG